MTSRRIAAALVLALLIAGACWKLWHDGGDHISFESHSSGRAESSTDPQEGTRQPAVPATRPPPAERSALADRLNAPDGNIQADLRILDDIFSAFRSNFPRAGNPVGNNIEITAVLAGRNALHVEFIPHDHPAINARGELCDRWGRPFFFHQLSGTKMEIRSAGPDRKFWTADDAVLTPE